jgi:hypothetical protein
MEYRIFPSASGGDMDSTGIGMLKTAYRALRVARK